MTNGTINELNLIDGLKVISSPAVADDEIWVSPSMYYCLKSNLPETEDFNDNR